MNNEHGSFAEIYDAHMTAIWRFCAASGMSGHDLEDVVQEVFVVALQRLHQFEGRSSLRTWLIGIAINVMRSFRRRRATRVLGSAFDALPELSAQGPLPLDQAAARQDLEFLHFVLSAMTDLEQEAFLLCDFEEMSAGEAAALLSVNENTLRTRLRAARLRLHAELAKRK